MKQRVVVLGILFLLFFALVKSGIIDSLFIFLLVGAIPGTSWSLPAGFMLTVSFVAVTLLAIRYTLVAILDERDLRRRTQKYIARRERMPKKRFRSIPR